MRVELVDAPLALPSGHVLLPGEPARLVQPLGIQLEDIGPGHQHIDLIYVARPLAAQPEALTAEEGASDLGWYAPDDWTRLGVTEEVKGWAAAALQVASDLPRENYLV